MNKSDSFKWITICYDAQLGQVQDSHPREQWHWGGLLQNVSLPHHSELFFITFSSTDIISFFPWSSHTFYPLRVFQYKYSSCWWASSISNLQVRPEIWTFGFEGALEKARIMLYYPIVLGTESLFSLLSSLNIKGICVEWKKMFYQ